MAIRGRLFHRSQRRKGSEPEVGVRRKGVYRALLFRALRGVAEPGQRTNRVYRPPDHPNGPGPGWNPSTIPASQIQTTTGYDWLPLIQQGPDCCDSAAMQGGKSTDQRICREKPSVRFQNAVQSQLSFQRLGQ